MRKYDALESKLQDGSPQPGDTWVDLAAYLGLEVGKGPNLEAGREGAGEEAMAVE